MGTHFSTYSYTYTYTYSYSYTYSNASSYGDTNSHGDTKRHVYSDTDAMQGPMYTYAQAASDAKASPLAPIRGENPGTGKPGSNRRPDPYPPSHREGKWFVVRADERLTAFMELECDVGRMSGEALHENQVEHLA